MALLSAHQPGVNTVHGWPLWVLSLQSLLINQA